MSATAFPFGVRPVYHPTGLVRPATFTIASGYATSIFKDDPVILNTNGTITVGTAAAALLGTFAGCEYTDATGKPNYSNFYPAGQTIQAGSVITCYVVTGDETVFEVQAQGSLTQSSVGDEADIVYTAGSTATGLSGVALSTVLAGAGLQKQWRIIGFGQDPDNAAGDAFTVVRVVLSQNQLRVSSPAI